LNYFGHKNKLTNLLSIEMEKQNWLEKYRPKSLEEVLGDKSQINRIHTFLQQFTKKSDVKYPNIIVSGQNGVGKSIIVDLAIRKNHFEKQIANTSNITTIRKKKKSSKETSNHFNRTIKSYYYSLANHCVFSENGKFVNKKIALVFDDVCNISNMKFKEVIKALVKMNNKLKQIPIIIISNNRHSKTIHELRKSVTYQKNKKDKVKIVNEVIIKPPDFYELQKFINHICQKEEIKLVNNGEDDIYELIINHSQFDIRKLISTLEKLSVIYQGKNITPGKFLKYCEIAKTKDIDPGLYESTRLLLNKYQGINKSLILYSEERAAIPLMVHENYLLNIKQQYPNLPLEKQMDIICRISKSISESDRVDGIIYSNQCWNLQSVHGFYSCVLPSYYINQLPGKINKMEKYRYTRDYNRTCIKKINNKAIKKTQENQFFKDVSINNFPYIPSILKNLLEKKKYQIIADILKPYHLCMKDLDSIIKIDKINKTKITLPGKEKNIMKELLEPD
jgi:hypothetical protein